MSEIQAEGLSTAATNPTITNDSKKIPANGGEEGSFRNPQTEERQPGNTSGSGSAGNGDTTSVGAAPSKGDETPGHEKKAPKGSLSGGTGFEKPSSGSEKTIGGSYTDQLGSSDWLGGPQNGNETPGNGGNGGNGGNSSTPNDELWTGRGRE
jgi:hypothetical protein